MCDASVRVVDNEPRPFCKVFSIAEPEEPHRQSTVSLYADFGRLHHLVKKYAPFVLSEPSGPVVIDRRTLTGFGFCDFYFSGSLS
jgi:hypothetical protein